MFISCAVQVCVVPLHDALNLSGLGMLRRRPCLQLSDRVPTWFPSVCNGGPTTLYMHVLLNYYLCRLLD